MNYRRLGRYGVKVSEVSVGGWLTQGRSITDDTTSAIVHRSFDLGINFFDTADVYNNGESEKSLGIALKDLRRRDVFVATKCWFPFSEGVNDRGSSRKHIVESVNDSLKRLQMDYIDLMQLHRWDDESPMDEKVRAMDDLIRQGKILYWGVSEWHSHQIAEACQVAEKLNACSPASNQPVYNMMNRYIEESVIPASERYGLGQVVFSPLAQGVLTGKYKPGQPPPAGSRGADDKSNMFMGGVLEDKTLEKVQKLEAFTKEVGAPSLAAFALAWILRQSNVSSVIIGATKPEQVEANALASGLTYGPDVWEKAEGILAG